MPTSHSRLRPTVNFFFPLTPILVVHDEGCIGRHHSGAAGKVSEDNGVDVHLRHTIHPYKQKISDYREARLNQRCLSAFNIGSPYLCNGPCHFSRRELPAASTLVQLLLARRQVLQRVVRQFRAVNLGTSTAIGLLHLLGFPHARVVLAASPSATWTNGLTGFIACRSSNNTPALCPSRFSAKSGKKDTYAAARRKTEGFTGEVRSNLQSASFPAAHEGGW